MISVQGKRRYAFLRKYRETERHPLIEGVCNKENTENVIICKLRSPSDSLYCTREEGHTGQHHGANFQYCQGGWD